MASGNRKSARKPKYSDTAANKARRKAKQGDGSKGKPLRRIVKEFADVEFETPAPTMGVVATAESGKLSEGIYFTRNSGSYDGKYSKHHSGITDSRRLQRILTGNVRHDALYRGFEINNPDTGYSDFHKPALAEEGRTKNPQFVAQTIRWVSEREYHEWLRAQDLN